MVVEEEELTRQAAVSQASQAGGHAAVPPQVRTGPRQQPCGNYAGTLLGASLESDSVLLRATHVIKGVNLKQRPKFSAKNQCGKFGGHQSKLAEPLWMISRRVVKGVPRQTALFTFAFTSTSSYGKLAWQISRVPRCLPAKGVRGSISQLH